MFIAHILHGSLVLFVFVFGLPMIFVIAMNILTSHRAPLTQSLRVFAHILQAVYKGVSNFAEAFAEIIMQWFPAHQGWMKPLLKPLLTIATIITALYFISECIS